MFAAMQSARACCVGRHCVVCSAPAEQTTQCQAETRSPIKSNLPSSVFVVKMFKELIEKVGQRARSASAARARSEEKEDVSFFD